MTQRRPPGITTESWIERQIREAEQRGQFANLPGAGKPLTLDDEDLVAKVVRNAGVDVTDFLPPPLRLAKQVEDLQGRLARESSESRARAYVEELNREIRAEIPKPQNGPPLRVRPVDVDAVMAEWAALRTARLEALQAARAAATPAEPPVTPRRSWFRRR